MKNVEEGWSSRMVASSGAAEWYLERRPVRHGGGEWMAVEGLRWVKERAEKLPTRTSQHPCYPSLLVHPCVETGRRRARGEPIKERKREGKREWKGGATGQRKVWASVVSRHIFFRLKQFFCSFLAIHPRSSSLPFRALPHRKLILRSLALPRSRRVYRRAPRGLAIIV